MSLVLGVAKETKDQRAPQFEWEGGPEIWIEGDWEKEKVTSLKRMVKLTRRTLEILAKRLSPLPFSDLVRVYFVRLYTSGLVNSMSDRNGAPPSIHVEIYIKKPGSRNHADLSVISLGDAPLRILGSSPQKLARILEDQIYQEIDAYEQHLEMERGVALYWLNCIQQKTSPRLKTIICSKEGCDGTMIRHYGLTGKHKLTCPSCLCEVDLTNTRGRSRKRSPTKSS